MTYECNSQNQLLQGKTFCGPTVIRLFVIRKVCPDAVRLKGETPASWPCLIHSTRIPRGVIRFLTTRFFKKKKKNSRRKQQKFAKTVFSQRIIRYIRVSKRVCVVFNSAYCILMLVHRFKCRPQAIITQQHYDCTKILLEYY